MQLPLISPGGYVKYALILEQEFLDLLGHTECLPEQRKALQCSALLDSEREQLMDGSNRSLLHAALSLK